MKWPRPVVVLSISHGDESFPELAESAADDDSPDSDESVASAYESMVWRDSTDDGIDGGMLEHDKPGDIGNGSSCY